MLPDFAWSYGIASTRKFFAAHSPLAAASKLRAGFGQSVARHGRLTEPWLQRERRLREQGAATATPALMHR
jgi:hypothetical protein